MTPSLSRRAPRHLHRWLTALTALLVLLGTFSATWARGQRQSPEAEAAKFKRVAGFSQRFDGFRSHTRAVLQSTRTAPRVTQDVALAAIATIMHETSMRVGSERYTRRAAGSKTLPSGKVKEVKPSFGASSLRKEHVTVQGDSVRLQFWGKSGVRWDRTIKDADLARTVGLFMAQPGERLWQVPGKGGRMTAITESTVNGLFAQYSAKPKDMRTMLANQRLDAALKRMPRPTSLRQAEQNLTGAINDVAGFMGHEPATCRTSYLKPSTLQQYTAGLR